MTPPVEIEARDLPFLAVLLATRDAIFAADRFGPAGAFVQELRERYRAKGVPWSATAEEWDGGEDMGMRGQAVRLHEMGVIRLTLVPDEIASAHVKLPKATAAAVRAAVRDGKAGRANADAWVAYRQARRFMHRKLVDAW